jgi:hypothetical protein
MGRRMGWVALVMWAALGISGCSLLVSPGLKSGEAAKVGLSWRECPLSQGDDPQDVEICFGHPVPLRSESEKASSGTRFDMENLQLAIGQDVYQAKLTGSLFTLEMYSLYRNGDLIKTLYGQFTAYSPNVSLQAIDGKAAWEFSDGTRATIIYDSVDVRDLYHIDKAYRPYSLGDKLIFIGQKDSKYFVVYDGWKVGPDFDQIVIAYCCETMLWSVQAGGGKYLFWGERDGQRYLVEIGVG